MAVDSHETDANWNFGTLFTQGILVNARYQLVSGRLVLPFLYIALGGPALFAGLILPIGQVSILTAQLMVAPLLADSSLRKWYIALALILMATSLGVFGVAAYERISDGLVALYLLVGASLGICRGVSALAFQDLVGQMLPKQQRGRLLFGQSALAGLFAILIALSYQQFVTRRHSLDAHLDLIWAGITLLTLACIAILCLREERPPASPAPDRQRVPPPRLRAWRAFRDELSDALAAGWFRHFMIARGLAISVELAMPFYAMHAAGLHAHRSLSLSTFVIASSVGLLAGGVLWERVGRISVPSVMALASLTGCAAGGLAVVIDLAPTMQSIAIHSGVFFLTAVAAQGVRVGRRLYIVNKTTDAERPRFIAVGNAIGGVVGGIMAFALGAIAHIQHVSWPIWCLVALNLSAAIFVSRLERAPPLAAER